MRRLAFIAALALASCGGQEQAAKTPPAPIVAPAAGAPIVKVATLEQLPAPLPLPYQEGVDVQAQLDAAFAEAKANGKRVLINYGGNWCSWCRALEGVTLLPEVKPFIDANFVVVHVSTGPSSSEMNSRPETYQRFGVEKIDGTPYLVVAEADGKVLHRGSEVTDQDHETPQAMVNWLAQYTKPAVITEKAPA
jgi:thiol:disulfide interchange protein